MGPSWSGVEEVQLAIFLKCEHSFPLLPPHSYGILRIHKTSTEILLASFPLKFD